MTLACYNIAGVIQLSRVEQILQEVQTLTPEELKVVCQALLLKVAVPLRDPRDIYDDWDSVEVDAAYADAW